MEINDFTKMKKVASILKTILHVLFWMSLVLIFLLVVGEIVIAILPKDNFVLSKFYVGDLDFAIGGMLRFELSEELAETINLKKLLMIMIPSIMLSVGLFAIIIREIKLILISVIVDRPFDENNSKSLYRMSIALIIASFLIKISESILFVEVSSIMGVNDFDASYIPKLTMLAMGIFLLILSNVFKYGNYLQNEFDQTV